MSMVIGTDLKTCKGCGESFPRLEFPMKSRPANIRHAYCVTCLPERKKKQREVQEKSRVRSDRRRRTGGAVDRERPPKLSGARLTFWLVREKRRLYAQELDEFPEIGRRGRRDGTDQLASMLGTDPRQVARIIDTQMRRYPHTSRQVGMSLDIIDRWFCHAGRPQLLRDLFPELYRWDDAPEYNMDTPLVDIPDDQELEALEMAA